MIGGSDGGARRAGADVRRTARRAACALAVLALGACTDDAGPTVAGGSLPAIESTDASTAPTDATGSATTTPTTVAGEMRPVPTVPPSTLLGQAPSDDGDDGVVNASPTIAPVPVDPAAPTTSVVPPTTDLVGDPQPIPDTTSVSPPPPPPTAPDAPDACERLAEFDIAGVIGSSAGVTTSGEAIAGDACRYASGGLVVEVHFVPVAQIRDDWNKRDGIEPVGAVSSAAVGFASFIPPGATPAAGYTIAAEGGSHGVVVAVTGTGDARLVAGDVAVFANQVA